MNRLAWHFLHADMTARGGYKVEIGKACEHSGPVVPCESGLHASVRAIDALTYSTGPIITLVDVNDDCGEAVQK